MGRLKSSLSVAQSVHRLVRMGGMPEPRWLAAAERLGLHIRPPAPKQRPRVPRPPRLVFPEDRAMQAMLRRKPQIKSTPVDLTSFTPPALKSAALAAEAAIRAGAPRRAALRAAADDAAAAAPAGAGSVLEAVQRAEEEALLGELARVRREKADKAKEGG